MIHRSLIRNWSTIFLLILLSSLHQGCEFFDDLLDKKKEVEDILYGITSYESQSEPSAIGSVGFEGRTTSALKASYLYASGYGVTVWIQNGLTHELMFEFEPKNGTFNTTGDLAGNTVRLRFNSGRDYPKVVSGTTTVIDLKVTPLDETRGTVTFSLKGSARVAINSSDIKDLNFDFKVDFDNTNDPPKPIEPINTGGNTGGSSDCDNTILVRSLKSYYSQIDFASDDANGTGRRANANTIFADYNANDVALIIDGEGSKRNPATRYVIQIALTRANFVANKTIDFRNAGTGTGLTNTGAVGRLIAFRGTVNDDWRTNRDFGKNKKMGTLVIKTVTPQITGTYEFDASGDGYPSLNNQFVKVSGSFCIDP